MNNTSIDVPLQENTAHVRESAEALHASQMSAAARQHEHVVNSLHAEATNQLNSARNESIAVRQAAVQLENTMAHRVRELELAMEAQAETLRTVDEQRRAAEEQQRIANERLAEERRVAEERRLQVEALAFNAGRDSVAGMSTAASSNMGRPGERAARDSLSCSILSVGLG